MTFTREHGLEQLRRLRAEMFDSISAVWHALAAPAAGRAAVWQARVHLALDRLAADFGEHVAATEAPDGLHADIVANEPRLRRAVERLAREHVQFRGDLEALLGDTAGPDGAGVDAEAVRERATDLLARLARHRQRGADLIYEAYATDIGGET